MKSAEQYYEEFCKRRLQLDTREQFKQDEIDRYQIILNEAFEQRIKDFAAFSNWKPTGTKPYA